MRPAARDSAPRRRVAIVGSGIAGLGAAWQLADHADVTLFEAESHFGGHAHTVDLTLDGTTHGVDTGFLVFNERTYPRLLRLFAELGVATAASDMSFSVQSRGLEWCGSGLDTVFAQRRRLLSPRFWAMLAGILRFNRVATALATASAADSGLQAALARPIGEFLREQRFGDAFRDDYLLPMIGCIWSCPTRQMLQFPVATLVRFCHNHGLLQVTDRPRWHTVRGGSRNYVRGIVARLTDARLGSRVTALRPLPPASGAAGVVVDSERGSERFDEVVLACHAGQALALLGGHATPAERELLGAIRTQPNRAVLHTDASLMPRRRRAWAAWNYERAVDRGGEDAGVCLHYWINRLQPLPWQQPVLVSLNPVREPDPARVHGEFVYAHPVFDHAALAAQGRLGEIQGRRHVWFCGAWTGYGFHEDGLASGMAVAQALQAEAQVRGDGWRASA